MLAELSWFRPEYLYLLIPTSIIAYYLYKTELLDKSLNKYFDKQFIQYLKLNNFKTLNSKLIVISVTICWLIAILALTGPSWTKADIPTYKENKDYVLILDLSVHMLAKDIAPDRITMAKYKILDILHKLGAANIGMIVFANKAHVVSPITSDIATIKNFLVALGPDIMPKDGNNIKDALTQAQALLKQNFSKGGNIILLTASNVNNAAIKAAKNIDSNFKLSVIGVSTREGAPIPINTGFLQNDKGELVISKLDDKLKLLASSTNAKYSDITLNNNDINKVIYSANLINTDSNKAKHKLLQKDNGYFLVLAILPIFALLFRRGILFVVLLTVFSLPQQNTYAFDSDALLKNKHQRAKSAYRDGDYNKVLQINHDKNWQAASLYKLGKYDAAEKLLANSKDSDSLYNLGNAQAKQKKFQQAIDNYTKALQVNNSNIDAKYNLQIVKKLLKEQQQDNNSQDNNKSKQQDDKQSSSKNDNNQQEDNQNQQANKQNSEKNSEKDANKQSQEAADKNNEQSSTKNQQAQKDNNTTEQGDANASKFTNNDYENPELMRWLKEIPDNPKELLKRKFLLDEYKNNS